jgi:predicted transcriptional regulator
MKLKTGNLDDFFVSAKQTAKEIDQNQKITKKNCVWLEPQDLLAVLKPERTKIIQFLRKNKKIVFSQLAKEMQRTPVSLNNDLKILSKCQLIRVSKESNPGHGIHKVIEPLFNNEKIEFNAQI